MTIGCACLAAGCGLDLAGEELFVDAGRGAPGAASDDGAAIELDGGTFESSDATTATEDGGLPREPRDGSTRSDGAPGSCDFTGTWGSRLTVDVTWTPAGLNLQTFVLAPGAGTITQWIMGARVQHGTSLEDTTVVCGIVLPDFQGTQVVAGQVYGVIFPDSLFDGMKLPTFEVDGVVTRSAPGATYSTSAAAALLGLTMANPTTDPWPATVTTATDSDNDGTPGVTVNAAQGPVPPPSDAGFYSDFPVGIPAPFQPVVVADSSISRSGRSPRSRARSRTATTSPARSRSRRSRGSTRSTPTSSGASSSTAAHAPTRRRASSTTRSRSSLRPERRPSSRSACRPARRARRCGAMLR